MPIVFYSPVGNDAHLDAAGNPLVGGKLYTYIAGSAAAQTTYTDFTGGVAHANPIVLNARGEPPSPVFLPSAAFKFVLKDAADVTIWSKDGIRGINDTANAQSEWVSPGLAPTFISATQFSLVGDQTSAFHRLRRIKAGVTAGTVYGFIRAVAFTTVTTVTVELDSGNLDSGLSTVDYGLLSGATNTASPQLTVGAYRCLGNDSKNNTATPNTQFDLNATIVELQDFTTGHKLIFTLPGVRTNNVLTAGPAAGGRDQAGAFSANSWIHFWWISDGDNFQSLSSLSSDPNTLVKPAGYTHVAYCGAVRFNGSSQLIKTRIKGAAASYEAQQSVLAGGGATTETAITISGFVPPNALTFDVECQGAVTSDASGFVSAFPVLRVVPGSTIAIPIGYVAGGLSNSQQQKFQHSCLTLPNLAQTLFYLWSLTTGSSPQLNVFIFGYSLPNGDS